LPRAGFGLSPQAGATRARAGPTAARDDVDLRSAARRQRASEFRQARRRLRQLPRELLRRAQLQPPTRGRYRPPLADVAAREPPRS
jgi:hypothetical protein